MIFVLQVTAQLLLLSVSTVLGFSKGPPLSTCESKFPHHKHAPAQQGLPPYNINVSALLYSPGDNLTVTISGSQPFTGFILNAQGTESSIPWPVGTFTQIPNYTAYFYCSGGNPKNTVGQNNPKPAKNLNSLQFTWMAPEKSAGNISFIATIVQNYSTFWEKVTSPVVHGPPVENVTRGTSMESFQIDKKGCGETKGCYSLPSNCAGSGDCTYLFTYNVSGRNVIIDMSAKERWVAVAFNENKLMDKMDSIMCTTMATNLAEFRHFYSIGHSVVRQDLTGNSDVTFDKIVYEDGGIKCRVTRKLTSNAVYFRDLTKKWYLLFSWGKTSTYNHSYNRVLYLTSQQPLQGTNFITKDGCRKTKSCYSEPANCKSSKDCDYLVTMKPTGDQGESGEVEFELSAKKQWVAIGFNNEKDKMDGTDALICAEVNDKVTVEHYMADQGYGRPTKTTPTPASIIVTLAESKDGVVACRFKRKKKDDKMVDLTKTWHLVYASGPMSGDKIGIHSTTPKTSPQKVDVCAKGELVAAEKSITLVQVAAQLLLLSVSTVFGFSKGPPLSACENKFPHHKRAVAQQGLPPYNISVSSLLYNPGDNLTVIISGSQPFKGFILNAQGTESSIPRPVGTFTQIPSYTASLDCSGDEDTVGHKNPNPAKNLNSLQFTWMAPEKSAGNISFIATIVQNYSTFWEKVSSPVVHGPPAEGPTSGTSTESSQSQKITKDGCGKTKSCYSEPANCKSSKDCEYLVTIKPEGDQCESVEFELSTKKQWGAIGFNSEKNKMLHRLLMVLTVVLTILGVILIFVHAGRWTKEAGAHPITGIFVLVLAVIQPIMAVFRPHPGEEKRYIFNWAHRGVGLSALILAVVTVFFGLRLPHSRLGDPALYPMVAYCVALILVVAYDIYDTLTTSRGGASFNVGPSGGKEDGNVELQPPGVPVVNKRKFLFAFTVLVSVGVVIALLVLIAIADGESHKHDHDS
ncbi:uncharacterized protein LOC113676667 [Pocillopora damicornis]|uniref:uncharacterized protein LOC113676667 n=1 Tax=Pocillopora damicornis TaxID=46731 RepID=UPI000F556248|nr:uncharacterized protein LOC113676667 [Pocillopora damicornis]